VDWHAQCKALGVFMTFLSSASRLVAVALLALGTSLAAAEGGKPADVKASSVDAAKEKIKKGMTVAEARKLYSELSKQRDVLISELENLLRQMKDATEERKKEIKEQMEKQKKNFDEVTNALHKQIRDEQRKLRRDPGTGRR
jgi:hypothetical protein